MSCEPAPLCFHSGIGNGCHGLLTCVYEMVLKVNRQIIILIDKFSISF